VTARYGTAEVTLPSDREFSIRRVFDAPAELVFDVWTSPAAVRRWWSDTNEPVMSCDIDLRVGGTWRYVIRTAEGAELAWSGVYREIERPHRLVTTELFEPFPDALALSTMTLEERAGATTMRVTVRHATKEARDGHLDAGMEPGMQLALNRVDDILAERLAAREAIASLGGERAGAVAE
jgi:uncharacterized protein YndB with AHSA1/START domain